MPTRTAGNLPGETPFIEEHVIQATYDEDGVQVSSAIGKDGKEYPDPVPMSPPVGYDAPPDLATQIRRIVRGEQLRQAAEQAGYGSFEEEDDFVVEDDPLDQLTEYERIFDPPPEGGPPGAARGAPEASSPPAATPPAPASPSAAEAAPAAAAPVQGKKEP